MKSILLDFLRFTRPHSGDAACELLNETPIDYDLEGRVQAFTTDDACNIIKSMENLVSVLNSEFGTMYDYASFQIRYTAHVINFGDKESLKLVLESISTNRALIWAVKAFVKRRDLFKKISIELNQKNVTIPSLDEETRVRPHFT